MNTIEKPAAKKDNGANSESPLTRALVPLSLAVIGVGALLLLPALSPSLFNGENVYWYMSRSSALVAFALFWASMIFGVSITNKLSRIWPGAPLTFELHQYTSLLGIGFVVVHILSLLGDDYIGYNILQLLLPFGSGQYETFWVGVGQLAFYLMIPVAVSFYARKRLGAKGWRTIHGLSYAFFFLALGHGLFSGTDGGTVWTSVLYWFTAVTLLGMTAYRVAIVKLQPSKKEKTKPVAAPQQVAA